MTLEGPHVLSETARKIYKMVDALVAQGWSYLRAFLEALRKLGVDPNSSEAEEAEEAMTEDHPDWIRK
jgi:hypothetical protein